MKRNPNIRLYLKPYYSYHTYDKESETLTLPRGLEGRLRAFLRSRGESYTEADGRALGAGREKQSFIGTLRDYQLPVAKRLSQRIGSPSGHSDFPTAQGILRLGTGWGKTVLGVWIAAKLGQKTIVLAPRLSLLVQWRQVFTSAAPAFVEGLDYIAVTPTTFKNWVRCGKIDPSSYGLLLVDECHQAVAEGFSKAVNMIPAKYRFGLTGTCDRSDGQGEAIKYLFGDILVDEDLPHEKPEVHVLTSNAYLPHGEYFEIAEALAASEPRNLTIMRAVVDQAAKGRRVLILTKRIEHHRLLQAMLPFSVAVSSGDDKVLPHLKDNPVEVVLGTYSLLSTGVDLPWLDTLVFAGDLKSEVLSAQSIGRILRLHEGKKSPLIIDVADTGHPILRRQHQSRLRFYGSRNWKVTGYLRQHEEPEGS